MAKGLGKNMAKCVGDFGWQSMGGDAVKSLSNSEIGDMLTSITMQEEGEEHVDEGNCGP